MKTSYFTYFENNLLKRPPGSLGAIGGTCFNCKSRAFFSELKHYLLGFKFS